MYARMASDGSSRTTSMVLERTESYSEANHQAWLAAMARRSTSDSESELVRTGSYSEAIQDGAAPAPAQFKAPKVADSRGWAGGPGKRSRPPSQADSGIDFSHYDRRFDVLDMKGSHRGGGPAVHYRQAGVLGRPALGALLATLLMGGAMAMLALGCICTVSPDRTHPCAGGGVAVGVVLIVLGVLVLYIALFLAMRFIARQLQVLTYTSIGPKASMISLRPLPGVHADGAVVV